MATQSDVRRIALALPGVEQASTGFAFGVRNKAKSKGFAWVWQERVAPKRPRVPNPGVLAVRVANLAQKDLVLMSDRRKFFTEPHYDGFPAVLVRLDAVTIADLRLLLEEGWRCVAPARPTAVEKSALAKRPTRANAARTNAKRGAKTSARRSGRR